MITDDICSEEQRFIEELQERFARLGNPSCVGAASLEEVRAEVAERVKKPEASYAPSSITWQ